MNRMNDTEPKQDRGVLRRDAMIQAATDVFLSKDLNRRVWTT